MSFQVFIGVRRGLWSVLPETATTKDPVDSERLKPWNSRSRALHFTTVLRRAHQKLVCDQRVVGWKFLVDPKINLMFRLNDMPQRDGLLEGNL